MSGVEAELKIIVYGSSSKDPDDIEERFNDENGGENQRRVELTVKPMIPHSSAGSLADKRLWIDQFTDSIKLDAKHSRNWRCEFCCVCHSPYPYLRGSL